MHGVLRTGQRSEAGHSRGGGGSCGAGCERSRHRLPQACQQCTVRHGVDGPLQNFLHAWHVKTSYALHHNRAPAVLQLPRSGAPAPPVKHCRSGDTSWHPRGAWQPKRLFQVIYQTLPETGKRVREGTWPSLVTSHNAEYTLQYALSNIDTG